jgi:hypothetical protein
MSRGERRATQDATRGGTRMIALVQPSRTREVERERSYASRPSARARRQTSSAVGETGTPRTSCRCTHGHKARVDGTGRDNPELPAQVGSGSRRGEMSAHDPPGVQPPSRTRASDHHSLARAHMHVPRRRLRGKIWTRTCRFRPRRVNVCARTDGRTPPPGDARRSRRAAPPRAAARGLPAGMSPFECERARRKSCDAELKTVQLAQI